MNSNTEKKSKKGKPPKKVSTKRSLHTESNTKDERNKQNTKPTTISLSNHQEQPSSTITDIDKEEEIKSLRAQLVEMQVIIDSNRQLKQEKKRNRKNRLSNPFDLSIKNIAKNMLFPKVKFVTEALLVHYKNEGSIGRFVIEQYEKDHNIEEVQDKKDFWNKAKYTISEAIGEKRNAVQCSIRKKWLGNYKCGL